MGPARLLQPMDVAKSLDPRGRQQLFSRPAEAVQDLVLHLRRRLAAFGAGEQEIDGLGSLAEMVHAIRAAPLKVFLHLCRFLRLQQAQQEQLINIV